MRSRDEHERIVAGTHLLVAAGRRPNTDGLGLDATGVGLDREGFVRVDEYLGTNVAGVWAIREAGARRRPHLKKERRGTAMAQPAAKPQNFRCPACGAEYETKDPRDRFTVTGRIRGRRTTAPPG